MIPENLYDLVNFQRPSPVVAQDLIGRTIVTADQSMYTICETGAFEGMSKSKRPRLEDFTKLPGQIYAHFANATYHLAINTDLQSTPSVITIRAIAPVGDLSMLLGVKEIAKRLRIDKSSNDLIVNDSTCFYLTDDITKVPFEAEAFKPKDAAENVISFYRLKRK